MERPKEWDRKTHWSEEESKDRSYPLPCTPSSCRIWSDEEKISGEEHTTVFPERACISPTSTHQQTESCSHGGLEKQVSKPVLARDTQKWEFESKALDQSELNLRSRQAVMQKMLGSLKFQNSCCS